MRNILEAHAVLTCIEIHMLTVICFQGFINGQHTYLESSHILTTTTNTIYCFSLSQARVAMETISMFTDHRKRVIDT
jgi:hypothetical protein